MSKIFFKKELISFLKKKNGVALDLASGKGFYSKLLSDFNWKVDSLDIEKKFKTENFKNITRPRLG